MAVVGDISTADVDVSVRFRPVSGRVDRAALRLDGDLTGDPTAPALPVTARNLPGKLTERHYSPWVKARQERLEADVKRTSMP